MDAARSAEVPPETEPSGLMGSSSMRFGANRPTDVAKSNAGNFLNATYRSAAFVFGQTAGGAET